MLRRVGYAVRREQDSLARTTLKLAASRSAALVSSLHLDHTRRVVVPWLAEVAAGRVEPGTPETVSRARLLATEVRDDLYAPGFFDDELRQAVSRFRAGGGALRLRPGIAPGARNRSVGHVVRDLVGQLHGPHTVTVIPPADAGGATRVAIIPPTRILTPSPQVSSVRVEGDAFRTVISFRDDPISASKDLSGRVGHDSEMATK